MPAFKSVQLTFEMKDGRPVANYTVLYQSGDMATGPADRAFVMQLVSQFLPVDASISTPKVDQ